MKTMLERKEIKSTLLAMTLHIPTPSVCRKGYITDGATCVSCLSPISGHGGDQLVDGSMSTCLIPKQPQDGFNIQTSLLVKEGCRSNSNIILKIMVKEQTQCSEVLRVILIEKPTTTCFRLQKCEEISSITEEGNRVCGIGCQCADSAHQCLIHLVNEINSADVEICEIMIDM